MEVKTNLEPYNLRHQQLKSEIESKERELSHCKREIEEHLASKRTFLLILLNKGYYQEEGLAWILKRLVAMNCKPKFEDFPPLLDIVSRNCLLKEYDNIRRQC